MKFSSNKIHIWCCGVLIMLILVCCNSKHESGFVIENTSSQQQNIDSLIQEVPSYQDIAKPLKEAEIQFHPDLLPLEKRSVPQSQSIAALQTGILMSDMAYCRYFEQVHKAMFLSSQIEERMQALNIPTGEIQQVVIDLETHMHSRDTVIDILSGAYESLHDGLMKSKRTGISALIMTGAWIESSRLMLADKSVSNEMATTQWNKHCDILPSIISLMDAFESGIPEYLSPELHSLLLIKQNMRKSLGKIDYLHRNIMRE